MFAETMRQIGEERVIKFLQNPFYFGKCLPGLQDEDFLKVQAKNTN